MKRLTLLTAAGLLASAPLFAMDGGGVSISGEANFGVKFAESDDDSKNDLQFHHEFKVTFAASGTTDGGIGFGGEMTLDNTESVTSGKVTPAPSYYLVREDITDAAEIAALEKKYGFPMGDMIAAGTLIVSGQKTFSGFDIAEIAGHNDAISRSLRSDDAASTTGSYTFINRGGEITAYNISSLKVTGEGIDDDTNRPVKAGDTVTIGGTEYLVGTITLGDTKGNFGTLTDGDKLGTVTVLTGTNEVNDETTFTIGDVTYEIDTNATPTLATAGNTRLTAVTGQTGVYEDSEGNRFRYFDTNGADNEDDNDDPNLNYVNLAALQGTFNTPVSTERRIAASEAHIATLNSSVAASDKQKVNNHGEVYISMDMHKLTIGSDLDAADKLAGGLADPGFDGIGIDDVAEGVYGKSAKQVRYDGDFGVASVAVSYGDNAGDAAWAAGFSFNVEPLTFGAGFDSLGVMSIGMGFTQGAIAMNAMYSTDSDHDEADNEGFTCAAVTATDKATYNKVKAGACDTGLVKTSWANKPDLKNQAVGVDVSYQMSEATSVVLVAAQHKKESAHISYNSEGKTDTDSETPGNQFAPASYTWSTSSTTVDAFGVGFSHDLGGGATLKAGAGSVDSNAVADLGITMKF